MENFNAKQKQREWFTRVFRGEEHVITAPYESVDGSSVITISVPIKRYGETKGVLAIDIEVESFTTFISGLTPDNQLWIADSNGYILAAKYPEMIGEDLYKQRPSYEKYRNLSTSSHSYEAIGETFFCRVQQNR